MLVGEKAFNLHLIEDMGCISLFSILRKGTEEKVPREKISCMNVGEGGECIRHGTTFSVHVKEQVFQEGGVQMLGAMEKDASMEEMAL